VQLPVLLEDEAAERVEAKHGIGKMEPGETAGKGKKERETHPFPLPYFLFPQCKNTYSIPFSDTSAIR
jgi:hypothetical protein